MKLWVSLASSQDVKARPMKLRARREETLWSRKLESARSVGVTGWQRRSAALMNAGRCDTEQGK